MFECDTAHTVSTVTVLEKRADNKPPSVLLYSSHMPTTHFPKTSSANSQFISEYCKHQLKLLFSSTLCCIINHCLFQSARLLPARRRQKPTGRFYHYNPHYSEAGNPNATVKRFPRTSPVWSSSSDLLMEHLRGTAVQTWCQCGAAGRFRGRHGSVLQRFVIIVKLVIMPTICSTLEMSSCRVSADGVVSVGPWSPSRETLQDSGLSGALD
ncbi:unnamed protein product [Leuciscus chuanchicus]